MKTVLLVLIISAAAFAAGWFLKPSEKTPVSAAPPPAAAKAATPAPREANPFAKALHPADGTGGASFEPFRSVDEVLALMEGLVQEDELDELAMLEIMEALPRLMATDLATVRSLLEQLAGSTPKSPEVRMMAAAMLAGRWILQEPEGATGYILANPAVFSDKAHKPGGTMSMLDENEMGSVLAMAGIAMTARKNPAAARAMLGLLPKDVSGELPEMLTMMEAKADPGKFLTTTPMATLEEMDDFTPILSRWAKQDPQAALRWTQALEDADEDAWTAIAKGWADKDRAAATAWASSLTDADHRRATLSAIASKAVEGLDASQVDAALAGFPPEVATRARLEHLSYADHPPAAAAAMVQDIMVQYSGDSEIMEAATGPATAVMHGFMREDAGETQAIAWLSGLPEGPAKSRAVTILIDEWADGDPADASVWIKALPAGNTRESATVQLISEIRHDDPAGALEWARSISSEATRRTELQSIFRSWLPQNPHQAMEALQQFSAEEQTAMFSE